MRLTLPEPNPIETPVVGRNLFDLAHARADLLPEGLSLRGDVASNLAVEIKGRRVATFGMEDHGEIPLGSHDLNLTAWNVPIGPDLAVMVRGSENGVYDVEVCRDFLAVGSVDLEVDQYRAVFRSSDLDQRALDCLHNHFMREADQLKEVGGVALIDGLSHVDGSTDPRLMTLLASLDAKIEAGKVAAFEVERARQADEEARRRNEFEAREEYRRARGAEVDAVVDDFFGP